MNTVRLDGMRFVNESGNQVLFHGINVLARDRKDGHLYPWIYQAMPYFQRSGFNLIRLGIFWDGAEPEPGKIDYGYLEKLREIVGPGGETWHLCDLGHAPGLVCSEIY